MRREDETSAGRDRAPVRILVVDDEAAHAKALAVALSAHGFAPVECHSPNDAMTQLRLSAFDLLLTDMSMPEMDGITLLRLAKEIDPDMTGIIMTGDGTIDSAVEAMKAGAADYIQKPFRLSQVLPVLQRALAMRDLRVENAALERRLRARSADLEDSNRELESFSFSVAHDLRAPLRTIDGFSRILLEDFAAGLPAEAQQLLAVVRATAQEMNRLIADLLAFSRLGRQPLAREVVDVGQLVAIAVEGLRRDFAGREVEVIIGELLPCTADEPMLRQVFVNLLSNALKFTRTRERAMIEVDSVRIGGEMTFRVRDNGVGFDPKQAGKLFGIFQRLHPASEFEGNGVGLSLAQRIVHRHGGRIWAESEPDRGATFLFTLAADGASTFAPGGGAGAEGVPGKS